MSGISKVTLDEYKKLYLKDLEKQVLYFNFDGKDRKAHHAMMEKLSSKFKKLKFICITGSAGNKVIDLYLDDQQCQVFCAWKEKIVFNVDGKDESKLKAKLKDFEKQK